MGALLSSFQREVCALTETEGIAPKLVALRLACSRDAVYMRRWRAKQKGEAVRDFRRTMKHGRTRQLSQLQRNNSSDGFNIDAA